MFFVHGFDVVLMIIPLAKTGTTIRTRNIVEFGKFEMSSTFFRSRFRSVSRQSFCHFNEITVVNVDYPRCGWCAQA